MPNRTALETHIDTTSNNVTLSRRVLRSPAVNSTPAQSVTRKMFEPAVLAITIPCCPAREEKIETSFSGRVVASERRVVPRIVEEREKEFAIVVTECDSMYPERERARKPKMRWKMWCVVLRAPGLRVILSRLLLDREMLSNRSLVRGWVWACSASASAKISGARGVNSASRGEVGLGDWPSSWSVVALLCAEPSESWEDDFLDFKGMKDSSSWSRSSSESELESELESESLSLSSGGATMPL